MSNIRIDIASEFKDKGFKAAEKRTTSLNRKFDNLGRTAKRTFIAIAGIQALRRSVVAFAEEDRAANKLAASLRNLGLAYNTQAIEDYLEKSEKATAISKEELSPAIANLLTTTLNAEKSMTLLNLAMDISTSTGKDLTSVTTALSRAFNGNFASLGKLQTAFTTAELEAMGFEKSITALNDQFGGAAANNADTYAGKIDKMRIAFGDLGEELGKGIIAFLTSLGSGDYDQGLQKLVNFGTAIGNAFRRAGLTIEYTKALLSTGFRVDASEQFRLDEIGSRMANPNAAANRRANSTAANRVFLRDYAKQLDIQKKIVKERDKAAKLSEKDRKNQSALARAKAVFDLEKIQIEAALRGKITEEERTRLLLMKAILNEDAETATQLANRLKEIQDETKKLAIMLTSFPKANDPFADWHDSLKKLDEELSKILNMTSPQSLAIRSSASAGAAAMLGGDAAAAAAQAANAKGDASVAATAAAAAVAAAITPEEKASAQSFADAAAAADAAADVLAESADALLMAAAAAEMLAASELFSESIAAAQAAGVPTGDIIVNVAGTVVTEYDLAESLVDTIYLYQRAGKPITLQNLAI